jgi:hypothetical protein
MKLSKLLTIDEIKDYLLAEFDHDTWEDFVDAQSLGECQSIVSFLVKEFPQLKKKFGMIKVDETIEDEDGESDELTHHWVTYGNQILDFSKGTLTDFIEWDDEYDVEPGNDEWRYK